MTVTISPQTVVRLDADVISSIVAFGDITGLSFPVDASGEYLVEAFLVYQTALTTTGINFGVSGPASPVAVLGEWRAYTGPTTLSAHRFLAYDTGAASTGVAVANTPEYAKLTGLFRNGVNAGTFSLRVASEVAASTVTVRAGSFLRWQQTNAALSANVSTPDRCFGVLQLMQNLATMMNNMRANVQIIQAGKNAGTIATFADAQKATRDLGAAFLQRLTMNKAITDVYQTDVTIGARALGVVPADLLARYTLLFTWATNLNTTVITDQASLDAGVAAVLANVPASMLPF